MTIIAAGAAAIPVARRHARFPLTRRGLSWLRVHRHVAFWWMGSVAAMLLHASFRASADNAGFPVRGDEVERSVFGTIPTIWLQANIYQFAPGVISWATAITHASWFIFPWVGLLIVTTRRPAATGSLCAAMILLWATALLAFTLMPVAPPWMADPAEVARINLIRLGSDRFVDPNPLAALPSMHVALPAVIAIWFGTNRWRTPMIVFAVYTLLVAAEVVVAGEHYVVDVLAALALALLCVTVASAVERQLARRHQPTRVRLAPQRADSGQTLIEFALLSPVIIALIAAIIVFGLAMSTRSGLQQSVREGARQAAIGASVLSIENIAVGNSPDTLTTGDVKVCYQKGTNATAGEIGDPVLVWIKRSGSEGYPYTLVSVGGIFNAFGVSSLQVRMSPRATSRLERTVSTTGSECPTGVS